MIGGEISCLKKFSPTQLNDASSKCQSLNASQVLPRSRRESDDLGLVLLSLDLPSEDGNALISLGIQNKTKEGGWYDSAGQLVSYFDWLPNEPDNLGGNQSYAGLRINKTSGTSGWADFSGSDKLNLVCMKPRSQG